MAESWAEQTQALTEAWIEAQTKLWSDWASSVKQGATRVPGVGDWFQPWQEVARRAVAAWTGESDGVQKQVIERLFSGEEVFLGFIDMTLGMMKAVAPKIDVGDEWMELLRRFIDQIREDTVQGRGVWMQPERLANATGDISELWRLYVAQLERLYGPWASAYRDAATDMVEAVRGDRTAARRMYVGFLDAYEATFGRMLASPAVGYSRETTERLLKGFDAWIDVNRAGVDFQTEIANTGFRAMEALMRRLVEMSEHGEKITTLREFFDLWLDTSEKAYYELFGTDSFATLQGRFVNASIQYRRRQGELLDETMATIGLPGRREVDEVHRHVYDLRIELRYMKRDMAALRHELEDLRTSGDGRGSATGSDATDVAEEDRSLREGLAAEPGEDHPREGTAEGATPVAETAAAPARPARGRAGGKTRLASPKSKKAKPRSRAKKGGAASSGPGSASR